MKWEYISCLNRNQANNLGKEGWELVSVDSGVYYFKRKLRVLREKSQMELLGG